MDGFVFVALVYVWCVFRGRYNLVAEGLVLWLTRILYLQY